MTDITDPRSSLVEKVLAAGSSLSLPPKSSSSVTMKSGIMLVNMARVSGVGAVGMAAHQASGDSTHRRPLSAERAVVSRHQIARAR